MQADYFRQLYEYHFTMNLRLWQQCITPLKPQQFRQPLSYSVGSIRNQVVHVLNMEERWFSALSNKPVPGLRNPVHFGTASVVRAIWDEVETTMRIYLDNLVDTDLTRSIDNGLLTWEVLFHVLIHGTDHRAQLLVALAAIGTPTFPQDYAPYALKASR